MPNRSMKSGMIRRFWPVCLHDGLGAGAPTARHGGSNPERGQTSCKVARTVGPSPTLTRHIPGNAGLRGAHAMRWQDAERSTNVDDVRGRRFGGGGMPVRLGGMGGLSLGGLVAIMAITYLLGGDPLAVLTGGVPTETAAPGAGRQRAHRRRRQPVRQDGAEEHRDRLGHGVPRPAGTQLHRAAAGHVHGRRSRPPAAPTRRRSGPSTVRPTSASTSTSPSTTSSIAASARPATSPRPT